MSESFIADTTPTPQITALETINRYGRKSFLLYSALLIPTLVLLYHCNLLQSPFSKLIEDAWSFHHVHLGGIPSKILRIVSDILLFTFIGLSGLTYMHGYRRLQQESPEASGTQQALYRKILLWTTLLGLVLVAVIPFHSRDLYGYINRGAQQVFYGANPYVLAVDDIPGWHNDLMFHDHWIHNPCPYGFFFTLLAKGICRLSGHHFGIAFLLFKLLNVGIHVGITALVYKLAQRFSQPRPWLAAYLYGWNPLILLQMIANGHNDLLLAATLMLALAMVSTVRWRWAALPLLVLSIFTKYTTVLALPFIGLYLMGKRDWKALFIGAVVSVGVFILIALPYVGDIMHFPWGRMADNAGLTQHSLHSSLNRIVYYSAFFIPALAPYVEGFRQLSKYLLYVGFVSFFCIQLATFTKRIAITTPFTLLRTVTLCLMVLLLGISTKFNVWYIGMFFPLLFVLPEHDSLRRFGIVLSLFQLLAFTPLENLHIGNYLILTAAPFFWVYGSVLLEKYKTKPNSGFPSTVA